jgi:hypothetical protein
MSKTRSAIKILLVLSLLLGITTIFIIRSAVRSFVVEGAAAILVVYVVALLILLRKWSRWFLFLPVALSLFTIISVFSETATIKLMKEGYVPASVIISSGLVSQSALLVLSLVALIAPFTLGTYDP